MGAKTIQRRRANPPTLWHDWHHHESCSDIIGMNTRRRYSHPALTAWAWLQCRPCPAASQARPRPAQSQPAQRAPRPRRHTGHRWMPLDGPGRDAATPAHLWHSRRLQAQADRTGARFWQLYSAASHGHSNGGVMGGAAWGRGACGGESADLWVAILVNKFPPTRTAPPLLPPPVPPPTCS